MSAAANPEAAVAAFVEGMDKKRFMPDPRHYQIAVLSLLVAGGVLFLDIGIEPLGAAVIGIAALATQLLASRLAGLPRFDPLSAMVTALSLTLLLRTDVAALGALAAVLAIGSKFLLRIKGKHLFNPANVAIVSLLAVSDRAWVSTGQWGSATLSAFALACLGFLVLTKARRAETTLAFLLVHAGLLTGRALWLGDPLAIPLHQLQNGALLIFAFFMISDPKTTPDTAAGRLLYGAAVAGAAFVIRFAWYEPSAPLVALALCAPLVPVLDLLPGGDRYRWRRPGMQPENRPDNEELPDATTHANHHPAGDGRHHVRGRQHGSGLLRLLRGAR